jgi:hypothetical protein
LPGRTAREADDAFLAPLRRALSRLTNAQLFVSPEAPQRALLLYGSGLPSGDLPPTSSVIDGGILLRLRQQFRSVEEADAAPGERWHVSTIAYDYRLSRARDGSELLSWHWHPRTGVTFPHVHVAADDLSRKTHVPSGRVSMEAVLRMLLGELQVPAQRADWSAVLDETEARFIKHRRWHA